MSPGLTPAHPRCLHEGPSPVGRCRMGRSPVLATNCSLCLHSPLPVVPAWDRPADLPSRPPAGWVEVGAGSAEGWGGPPACLHQVHAQLLEGLQQAGVPDLLDNKDTLWALVPRQPLAGRVLDVPGGEERSHQDRPAARTRAGARAAVLPPAARPPGRASPGGCMPWAPCCLNAPTSHLLGP